MDLPTFLAIYDNEDFAAMNPVKVQHYLDTATVHIDPEIYGIHTEQAIGLLTAHYLILNPTPKATPTAVAALGFKASDVKKIEITDDIVVDVSNAVAAGTPSQSKSSSGLDATSYGQQLEALKRSLIIPFTFV